MIGATQRDRLADTRRVAERAALEDARRARRREIALVEQYLAQIRWPSRARRSVGGSSQPGPRL
ncbi:MAG TPA: hypothetical protein VGI27_06650 [Solirubrobacteraceae bacterium]|jgi:hypothetical protein